MGKLFKSHGLVFLILTVGKSRITEKTAAVHFPGNALTFKIFRKANGRLLKDRRKAGGRFVYSAKISRH